MGRVQPTREASDMEAILGEVLKTAVGAFLPGLVTYIRKRIVDQASHDVAMMQAIAKLEDERAKAKFPEYRAP